MVSTSHAHLPSMPGIWMFIPKNPVMNVGNMSESDITVRRFMIMFMLFPITDANASMVPVRMSEYMFAIWIACLLSVMASSRNSSSSSLLSLKKGVFCSFSRRISLPARLVVKYTRDF